MRHRRVRDGHRDEGHGGELLAQGYLRQELGFGLHKHLDGRMRHKLLKDVSKKITSGSNGISGEGSRRSKSTNLAVKSKQKLKGALSLVELKNDTLKNNGPHSKGKYQLKGLSHRSVVSFSSGKWEGGDFDAASVPPKGERIYCVC